ncbi:MAG: hypothetical protein KGQ46_06780 [Hyphomicrobiales bacterium]|nr:hypothetical protein [Hyphomicrobiales bacterium]MDE2113974.1 hypothetical protein [Hyphomicrobiales bacterium]
MFKHVTKIAFSGALLIAASSMVSTASAASVMQQCSAKYQAAKSANALGGATWRTFLAQCRKDVSATPAAAPVAAPAAAPVAAPAPKPLIPIFAPKAAPAPAPAPVAGAKPVTPGRAAETSRIRACGAQWKANKAQLVAATPGLTWPKYWSACNKQMKAAGQ